jgi:hypothetical protein
MYIYIFLLRMADTMTSQSTDLSSWDTLYRYGDHSKKSYEVGRALVEHLGDMLPNLEVSSKACRFE